MTKRWGTPTWYFFHSLAEHIDETFYFNNSQMIFNIIKSICSCLPCPDCTQHATQHLKTISINNIRTKAQFKQMLFDFHNKVNIRTGKPIFTDYDMYKSSRLKYMYSNFRYAYLNNNIKNAGFSDSLKRQQIIKNIDVILINYTNYFMWI
jgi:hypothetical protein